MMTDLILSSWCDTIKKHDIKFTDYQKQYEVAHLIFEDLLLQNKREKWKKIHNANLSCIDTYDPLGKYASVR
jgi:Mg2+ and Co2+ transporter CorA